MTQLLQNINRVEFIEVSLQYWRNFTELCLVGLASVEVSQNIENNSRLTTVKLTAHTTADFNVDHRRLAWRVTTVDGNQYLIGINEQPFPVTTVADHFPDKATERSGKTVTATWQTNLDLLKIMA